MEIHYMNEAEQPIAPFEVHFDLPTIMEAMVSVSVKFSVPLPPLWVIKPGIRSILFERAAFFGYRPDTQSPVIGIYATKSMDTIKALHAVGHEMGHLHHWHTDLQDMFMRTEYGREVYAEDFCKTLLGNRYNLYYATAFDRYEGYPNRLYRMTRDQLPEGDLTTYPHLW